MKNKYFYFILFCLFLFFLIGCSKLKDDATAPDPGANQLSIHTADFSVSHGYYTKTNKLTVNDCKKCHTGNNQAGLSDKACSCHNSHPIEFASQHVSFIKSGNWNITRCKTCHGADYKGGKVNSSCITCHTNGTESCNLCHGQGSNIFPPKALSGETSTTYRGVGAHVAHMTTGEKRVGVNCTECHPKISSFDSPEHLDTNPASEVIFKDSIANVSTKGRNKALMTWDVTDLSCKNTYCHGNFSNGNNYSPKWTKVGQGESNCGTCHNLPPKGNHPQLSFCSVCHPQTVDANMKIIDKNKHMNGILDLYGLPKKDW
jgi:predicted CxxxxCH...CXXCH cytochrome family protein